MPDGRGSALDVLDRAARQGAVVRAIFWRPDAETASLWRDIGNVAPLAGFSDRAVWRISVAPSRGAEVAQAIARAIDAVWFLDWGGGLVWMAVVEPGDAGASVIRGALGGPTGNGGHGQPMPYHARPE